MTTPYLVLAVAILFLLLPALMVAGLAHHKKAGARALNLIGAIGFIESKLDPEGAVIVDGELWRARLRSDKLEFVAERQLAPPENRSALPTRNRVRVVGVEAHLLLVEPSDQF